MKLPPHISIAENSWWARMAAKKLRTQSIAMVLGHTIHLYGVSKYHFLQNEAWVRHELKHVEQYHRHGFFRFVIKYLAESLKHGYYHNRFEAEARAAEQDKK